MEEQYNRQSTVYAGWLIIVWLNSQLLLGQKNEKFTQKFSLELWNESEKAEKALIAYKHNFYIIKNILQF